MMAQRFYIHAAAVLVSGQVNDSFDGVYPLADISVKSVTGDLDDSAHVGRTVIFGSAPGQDDLGRSYVRRVFGASDLLIGYSSKGTHDGEINIAVDSYWAILDDRRVWGKPQRFVTDEEGDPIVTIFKDYDLVFASHGQGLGFYPKANAGPARAGTIDPDTSVLTLDFDASTSYSMPLGVGLTGYLWDVGDGTITVGTTADAQITATFPAGLRYISLTVTDANSYAHTMYVPVYARDPAADTCVAKWQVEGWMINQQGQNVSVSVMSELPRSTYPDGALTLIFNDDNGPDHHCDFTGWHHSDSASVEFVKTGTLRYTVLNCLDLIGKLATISGQSQLLEHHDVNHFLTVAADAALGAVLVVTDPLPVALEIGDVLTDPLLNEITVQSNVAIGATAFGVDPLPAALSISDVLVYAEPPQNWTQMYRPSMYLLIDYILRWHSTALELADWSWPTLEFDLAFISRAAAATSIYEQVAAQCRAIEIDHNFGVNPAGQMLMRIDPQLQAAFSRTATVQATVSGHIRRLALLHERPPRYQWIRGGGVIEGWNTIATTVQVEYVVRPSAFADVSATTVSTLPLPTTIPNATVLYLRGLEGILLPWVTLAAEGAEGAESITVEALTETVDEWSELVYTASAAGPDIIGLAFCVAPGLVPGQGNQSLTVNGKLTQNVAGLASMIGRLFARLNSPWGILDIEIADSDDLGIVPADMTWVLLNALNPAHIPQRLLSLLQDGARLLPLEVSKSFSYSDKGTLMSVSLRVEVETVGIIAVTTRDDRSEA